MSNQTIEIQGLRFRAVDNGDGTFSVAVSGGGGGGAVSSVFGRTGAVVATSADYSYSQISSTPGVFVENEVPGGTINGSNTAFTLTNAPIAGSQRLFLNGIRIAPTTDYTISGANITMLVAPQSGDTLLADYRK